VILRLTGAAVRAFLVAILVALPAFLFKDTSYLALEFTRLLAAIAAIFVFYEYGFPSASVIEFRFTSPYNRIRFVLLAVMLASTCFFLSGPQFESGIMARLVACADQFYNLFSFEYSPVSIVAKTLAVGNPMLELAIGRSLSLNLVIGLVVIVVMGVLVFVNVWAVGGSSFNLWKNMPTYSGLDAEHFDQRLESSAFSSALLGLLLPLFGPTLVDVAIVWIGDGTTVSPIIMIWVLSFWIYLSTMYLMRAIILAKIVFNLNADAELVPA